MLLGVVILGPERLVKFAYSAGRQIGKIKVSIAKAEEEIRGIGNIDRVVTQEIKDSFSLSEISDSGVRGLDAVREGSEAESEREGLRRRLDVYFSEREQVEVFVDLGLNSGCSEGVCKIFELAPVSRGRDVQGVCESVVDLELGEVRREVRFERRLLFRRDVEGV